MNLISIEARYLISLRCIRYDISGWNMLLYSNGISIQIYRERNLACQKINTLTWILFPIELDISFLCVSFDMTTVEVR